MTPLKLQLAGVALHINKCCVNFHSISSILLLGRAEINTHISALQILNFLLQLFCRLSPLARAVHFGDGGGHSRPRRSDAQSG